MSDPRPSRTPGSSPAAQRVNRRFLSLFWLFAADFAIAAFWRPALVPFVIGFPIYVALWRVSLRRVRKGAA